MLDFIEGREWKYKMEVHAFACLPFNTDFQAWLSSTYGSDSS